MTSFTASGTPASVPTYPLCATSSSTFAAAASARSGEKVRKALVDGFSFSANDKAARVSSVAEKDPSRRPWRMEETVRDGSPLARLIAR